MRHVAIFLILLSTAFGLQVESGATDIISYFVMRAVADETRDTGIVIANAEMYYIIDQAAESADAFVGAHGAVTDAHTDGECIHVGHGVYRVDWPDAAFVGADGSRVQLTFVDGDAGAFTETIEVQLSPPVNTVLIEGSDATAVLNTALGTFNNALTTTVDIGVDDSIFNLTDGVSVNDAYNGMVLRIQDDTDGHVEERRIIDYSASGRRITLDRDLGFTPTSPDGVHIKVGGYADVRVTDLNATALAAIEGEVDDALVVQELDHLVHVADSDDPANDSIMAKLASTDGDWSNFSETTDSLQSIADALALFDTSAEWLALLSAVDTDATSDTHGPKFVTLEAGKASNDAYNGMSIAVTDATDGNTETRRIEDYTSGRLVTFDRALSFTPVQDDIVRIYSMPYNITAAIAGGSENTFIVTDTGDGGGTPIADVSVWVTADSAGARLVVSGVTDSNGAVIFYLDAGTTYYVWMAKSGYSFSDNGESWLAE